uniref:Retrotransposon gag domain-containing protein n=1 Tax=Tanacetum cinerariifolium TaxID=118510 RepID=A0A6L2J545_TANCI|nr:hypothetical protein [Tanacetum cinerariifolium]
MLTTRQGLSSAAIERLIAQHVADAIAAYEANQSNGNETQNKAGGSAGGVEHTTQGCSYKAFLNCQPQNFIGTKGAVGLTRWFEKMKFVFRISNCATDCQVKFATCTLLDGALTWWNSHVKTKLENKLWNLTVKGTDVVGYTQRFQELALLCPKMVLDDKEKIERYVLLLQLMLTTTKSGKMSRIVIITNNKTKGKKWEGYTLLELVTRHDMLELCRSTTSASFITIVHVPINVETARKSATKQEIVGPLPR